MTGGFKAAETAMASSLDHQSPNTRHLQTGRVHPSNSGVQQEEEASGPEEHRAACQEAMHAQLVAVARRRLRTLARYPPQTQKRRMLGWLQRRGHSWSVCRDVLEELGV